MQTPDELDVQLQQLIRDFPHLRKQIERMDQIEIELLELMPDPENEVAEQSKVTYGQLRKLLELVREEAILRADLRRWMDAEPAG